MAMDRNITPESAFLAAVHPKRGTARLRKGESSVNDGIQPH